MAVAFVLGTKGNCSCCLFSCSLFSSNVAAFVSMQFYWSSSVAVAIVLGARGIVPVFCSIVLPKEASHSCETLRELLPSPPPTKKEPLLFSGDIDARDSRIHCVNSLFITSQTLFFSSDLISGGKTILPVYGPNRVPFAILR